MLFQVSTCAFPMPSPELHSDGSEGLRQLAAESWLPSVVPKRVLDLSMSDQCMIVLRLFRFPVRSTMPYKYVWVSDAAGECATLLFYVMTGLYFRPHAENPYFALQDDEISMAVRTPD